MDASTPDPLFTAALIHRRSSGGIGDAASQRIQSPYWTQ